MSRILLSFRSFASEFISAKTVRDSNRGPWWRWRGHCTPPRYLLPRTFENTSQRCARLVLRVFPRLDFGKYQLPEENQ